jgi:hypothetical protein
MSEIGVERPDGAAPTIAPAMLPPSRSFDTPRTEASPGGRPASPGDRDAFRRPATLLPWTIKLCLALGLSALGATQYLSRATETGVLRQFARAGAPDPETTGSLGAAAARTTLDPCTTFDLRR